MFVKYSNGVRVNLKGQTIKPCTASVPCQYRTLRTLRNPWSNATYSCVKSGKLTQRLRRERPRLSTWNLQAADAGGDRALEERTEGQ
jgi:hypothetical protein